MPQITDEELAELQQLRALQAQQAAADAAVADGAEPPKPLTRPRRAVLANGTTHEYTGAHPTAVVDEDGRPVPVVSVFEL